MLILYFIHFIKPIDELFIEFYWFFPKQDKNFWSFPKLLFPKNFSAFVKKFHFFAKEKLSRIFQGCGVGYGFRKSLYDQRLPYGNWNYFAISIMLYTQMESFHDFQWLLPTLSFSFSEISSLKICSTRWRNAWLLAQLVNYTVILKYFNQIQQ